MPPSRSPTPSIDSMDTSDAPTVLPPDKHTLQLLHTSWHIPYLSHFTWLFQKQLALKPLPPAELEMALYHHNTSPTFHNLLTRLLIGSVERAKLSRNEYWSYDMLCELVELQYRFWFETLLHDKRHAQGSESELSDSDSSERDTKENSLGTADNPYDITKYEAREEAKYAHTVRQLFHYVNPLENNNFSDLAVDVKAAVLYSLADYYVCTGKEFVSHIRSLEASDQRIEPLGYDTDGNRYWYMGFIDWRIYRSTTPTLQIGQYDAEAAAAAVQRRSQQNTPTHKQQTNGHSTVTPSNLIRSASAAGAEEMPRFELVTSSSTELRSLINRLKKVLNTQEPHKLHMEKLVDNLEQVYTNLSEGRGHAVEAEKDDSKAKKRKPEVLVPQRGSARLEQLAVQQQAKQLEQQQDMLQKRTRRNAQVNHRAQEYKSEMYDYLLHLAKLIAKQASKGDAGSDAEDNDSVASDD